ncbi:kinase-like protein [Basidiobolus meristosporus CBS 931.73]|uniref:Kinase-like protein n=1 Tax=Basidiobolus meristosporus CBS 931.73 TaxID=1314790 RepID=A0A1Y1Y026_9FUNG|nr:kinase-like protein [Basidiobolus meristosporus CBS 931.73]|eukprot:ORX91329.1 kinase-like protein [Basidiobolus meristosporus CBS 931.73]
MVLLGTCNMLILSSTLAGCSFSTATLFATSQFKPEWSEIWALRKLVRSAKYDNWYEQVCDAYGNARSVRNDAVFITADNNYKLGDFGLYRSLAQRSVACSFVGPYSNKVDIWALGLLSYKLCCLKYLFHANNQEELLKQMKLKPPPEIPLIYPQSMLRLLRRMLDPEPLQRPTIQEIVVIPGVAEALQLT